VNLKIFGEEISVEQVQWPYDTAVLLITVRSEIIIVFPSECTLNINNTAHDIHETAEKQGGRMHNARVAEVITVIPTEVSVPLPFIVAMWWCWRRWKRFKFGFRRNEVQQNRCCLAWCDSLVWDASRLVCTQCKTVTEIWVPAAVGRECRVRLHSYQARYTRPWIRVLEKMTVLQLVTKFPAYCGTARLITAFTVAR
jgi:hypothetical protein